MLQGGIGAFGDDFDRALRKVSVADGSGQAKSLSILYDKGTEAYALYPAIDSCFQALVHAAGSSVVWAARTRRSHEDASLSAGLALTAA